MPLAPKLVVIEPTGSQREVEVLALPYRIGRQAENELPLRDNRISRHHAQIVADGGRYVLEDMGSRHGTFVNGQKVLKHELKSNDNIDFGINDSYRLIFRSDEDSIHNFVRRMDSSTDVAPASSRGLHHLGLLLEVARSLHSSLSLEDVLTSVVDAAIRVTHTERGVLLLCEDDGDLRPSVARDSRQRTISVEQLEISQSVLRQVLQTHQELIISDTADNAQVKAQASVVKLSLHTIVAIPLEKLPVMGSLDTTMGGQPAKVVGVLYLDSHSPTNAFTELDREVLRTLAQEGATVVENARLFALARQRERLDYEMKIAQGIQRQLLPKTFPESAEVSIFGTNIACEMVGGDYFDIIQLAGGRYGVVVADISGKGISAALLASMLQGFFSATAEMDLPQHMVASRVNKYLQERSSDDRYATLFYGVLEPSGQFEYINAGHVPAMVRTAGGQVYNLASDNFPLGMFDFADYHSAQAALQPGDFLVVYSDGISEARNMKDELFGEHGLRELLVRFQGASLDDLTRAILTAVREFTGGAPQSDDMTLLMVHYRGPQAP
jgi:serine phosphatase RsbU (regulator of sigma subunit)